MESRDDVTHESADVGESDAQLLSNDWFVCVGAQIPPFQAIQFSKQVFRSDRDLYSKPSKHGRRSQR